MHGKNSFTSMKESTPLMKQYYAFKRTYPDAILLFRVGDFYETFGPDAAVASEVLGIVLTKRANGTAAEVSLAGFPHHALDTYLPKLIKAGHRVAVCDQQETPEAARARGSKIITRSLSEIATPGLATHEGLLEEKQSRYLAALCLGRKTDGLSLLDLSTGEFLVYEGRPKDTWTQLEAHSPAELIFSKEQKQAIISRLPKELPTYAQEPWVYTLATARTALLQRFGTVDLAGFGLEKMQEGLSAAGAILQYLKDTSHTALKHISSLRRLDEKAHLWMDTFTVSNLELFDPLQKDGSSLCEVIDDTRTPMGGRLLRRWLRYPLRSKEEIEARQSCVAELYQKSELRTSLQQQLAGTGDLERLVSKISLRRVVPRDLLRLQQALLHTKEIKTLLADIHSQFLSVLGRQLQPSEALAEELGRSLLPEAATSAAQGRLFQKNYHSELDKLLTLAENEQEALKRIQNEEAKRTGIVSLKVSYNRVFGYYLEVRNTHKDKVPAHWIRRQTISGAERYTTEALKTYEDRLLSAEAARSALEAQLYETILEKVMSELSDLQRNATMLAKIDVLSSLASVAESRRYVRPTLGDEAGLHIQAGRHPVIEALLPPGETYVPNDLSLDEKQQILLITGPNMAGKSALLRQTALIVILAQVGAFVPAEAAHIGIYDKLFTRVGASDNIAAGRSTFMVEMSETANILNNISDRSLLLMDEIGRGTSTYDGLSVAWAILEHIHESSRAALLFASHYHELSELSERLERMQSFHVAVKEVDKEIIFLYALRPGGAQQSFGIHVARMAGMPLPVVARAEEILSSLQRQKQKAHSIRSKIHKNEEGQPSLF